MKYKGKSVSRHRYNQLLKSKENRNSKVFGMYPNLFADDWKKIKRIWDMAWNN